MKLHEQAVLEAQQPASRANFIISQFEHGVITYDQAKEQLKKQDLGLWIRELDAADELKKDEGKKTNET